MEHTMPSVSPYLLLHFFISFKLTFFFGKFKKMFSFFETGFDYVALAELEFTVSC